MKTIPTGRALIILVGPTAAGKGHFASKHFYPREVISTDAIRIEFTGDPRRQDLDDVVFDEYYRRIETRLRANQRVVADATHCRNKERRVVADIGHLMNAPVYYVVINRDGALKHKDAGWRANIFNKGVSLIDKYQMIFEENERTILAGDYNKRITVVDTRVDEFVVAQPLPREPDKILPFLLNQGYEYVRVIGDIHGNWEGLNQALEGVDDRGVTFPLFLGDIVDYGAGTLRCADKVNQLVMNGGAVSLRGNHEKKIANMIHQRRRGDNPTDSWGNNVTMNQLKAMSDANRSRWEDRFLGFVESCPDWIQIGDRHMFTHGAVHHRMCNNTVHRALLESKEMAFALYGETTGKKDKHGYPERLYNWVDRLGPGVLAVVGHAALSVDEPVEKKGSLGGTAVMLDTGSSKDIIEYDNRRGHLSWLDFEIFEGSRKSVPKLIHGVFGRES